jgi:beta-lactamase regulating signal transducer with metallopeptidase domain
MDPARVGAAIAIMLVQSLWQGALIAGVFAVAARLSRGAPPAVRYWMGCAALLSIVIAAVASFLLAYDSAGGAAAPQALPAIALRYAPGAPLPLASPARLSAASVLALFWIAGVTAMLARLLGGWLRLRGVLRRSAPAPESFCIAVFAIARSLGVRAAVRVAASSEVAVPMVIGALRPVILIPLSLAARVPVSVIEPILAHELAHVRRHDFLVNLLQSVAETLLFYHPAVWWISRSIRVEREYCCDDMAVGLTRDPLSYARALVALEADRPAREGEGLSVLSTGGPFMARIHRLIHRPRHVSPGAYRAASLRACGALLAVVAAAAMAVMPACGQQAEPLSEPPSARAPAAAPDTSAEIAIAWLPGSLDRYKQNFIEASRRHGVDPRLLAIVTLVESRGNPEAISRAGAIGLMQVMPNTGAYIAKERGIADYSPEKLKDPAYNIDFGAWLLSRNLGEFSAGRDDSEAVALAAAAYNGGLKSARAYAEEGKPLSEESARYQELVRGMWDEREEPASATYAAWPGSRAK